MKQIPVQDYLFSAQGADPREKSPFLFAKAKGRDEKRLLESSILNKYIFRPCYINQGRKSAQSAENRFKKLMKRIKVEWENFMV